MLRCSCSTISALLSTAKCREVALNESLIAAAISPTVASFRVRKSFTIASLRLLASALRHRSSSFIDSWYHNSLLAYIIRPFVRIRDRRVARPRKLKRLRIGRIIDIPRSICLPVRSLAVPSEAFGEGRGEGGICSSPT